LGATFLPHCIPTYLSPILAATTTITTTSQLLLPITTTTAAAAAATVVVVNDTDTGADLRTEFTLPA